MAQHIDCTNAEYHARPEWSRSQMEVARKSWPLFHGQHVHKPTLFSRDSSDDLDDGIIAHEALLNPAGLAGVFHEIPSGVLNAQGHRKGGKWTEWKAAHDDKPCRTEADIATIKAMVASVYADHAAEALLSRATEREYSVIWTDADTGLGRRARFDLLIPCGEQWIIADFKTTRAVEEDSFASHVAKYGYHRQAAWYWDAAVALGLDVAAFCLVVVNKSPAHECWVTELDQDDIELGRDENRAILRELKRRLEENDWRRPGAGVISKTRLPHWYRRTFNVE